MSVVIAIRATERAVDGIKTRSRRRQHGRPDEALQRSLQLYASSLPSYPPWPKPYFREDQLEGGRSLARVKAQLALQKALEEANEARDQSDDLLHAVLPRKAAEELRDVDSMIPRLHNKIAALVCDVTSWTAYCNKQEPEDVASRLDAQFVIFERIAAKRGLEKIKTIGDGFMAVAELLPTVEGPLACTVRFGLEMACTMIDATRGWEGRVGVNAGPVVAFIAGQERCQFDIWGDTVNAAARMLEKAKPSTVAVTEHVWSQDSSLFDGEELSALEVKEKSTLSIYVARACKSSQVKAEKKRSHDEASRCVAFDA